MGGDYSRLTRPHDPAAIRAPHHCIPLSSLHRCDLDAYFQLKCHALGIAAAAARGKLSSDTRQIDGWRWPQQILFYFQHRFFWHRNQTAKARDFSRDSRDVFADQNQGLTRDADPLRLGLPMSRPIFPRVRSSDSTASQRSEVHQRRHGGNSLGKYT